MLTEVRLSEGSFRTLYHVSSGFPVYTCTAPIPITFSSDWINNPYCGLDDPILGILNSCKFFGPTVGMSDIFSTTRYGQRSYTVNYGNAPSPVSTVIRPVGQQRLAMIKAFFSEKRDFLAPLGTSQRFRDYKEHENECSHITYTGKVLYNSGEVLISQDEHHIFSSDFYPTFRVYVESDGTLSLFPINSAHSGSVGGDLAYRLDDFSHGSLGTLLHPRNSRTGVQVDELSYEYNDDGVITKVLYSGFNIVTTHSSTYDYKVLFDTEVKFSYVYPNSTIVPYDGLVVSGASVLPSLIATVYSTLLYTKRHKEDDVWSAWTSADVIKPPSFGTGGFTRLYSGGLYTNPSPASPNSGFGLARHHDPVSGLYNPWDDDFLLHKFSQSSKFILPNTVGLLASTGKDAVDSAFAALNMNNLENIGDLAELRKFLEPLKTAALLARCLQKGDWVEAGVTLLDLLTSVYLLYKYGIVTSLSDAYEFVREIGPVIDAIRHANYFKRVVGHGSMIYEVPEHPAVKHSGVVVYARTKCDFSFTENGVLGALLPVKALGLLPTLANLWDTRWLSFVLDWVTGLGDKFGIIDGQIQALCLDVNGSTSSLKVSWDIPPEFLMGFGLTVISAPRCVHYERIVDPNHPSMSPSVWDLTPPSGIKWDIGISLAWQFIRAAA